MTASREPSRVPAVLLAIGMILLIVGVAGGLLTFRLYHVLSDSMTPALHSGDRLVSDDSFDGGRGIRRGDIVMLDKAAWRAHPERTELVKRVIGVGGDTVAYRNGAGTITVNGKPVAEDYLPGDVQPAYEDFSLRVPRGRLFVLGDNRPNSIDSRTDKGEQRGPVPARMVRGKVVAIAWPLDRIGEVPKTDAFGPAPGTPTTLVLTVGAVLAGLAFLLLAALAGAASRLRARRHG